MKILWSWTLGDLENFIKYNIYYAWDIASTNGTSKDYSKCESWKLIQFSSSDRNGVSGIAVYCIHPRISENIGLLTLS